MAHNANVEMENNEACVVGDTHLEQQACVVGYSGNSNMEEV